MLTGLAGVSGFSVRPAPRFDTSIAAVGDAALMSGLLAAGVAVAAYQEYRTDKFEAVKEFTKTQREQLTEGIEELQSQVETLTEKVATANGASEATPATAPVAVVAQEPVAVVETPAPAPVAIKAVPAPAPKVEAKSAPEPKPVAAVALERSKPSPEKTDRTASEDLTELVKKVGKTVEQNKEMEDLVKSRREKETAAEKSEEDAAKEAVAQTEEHPKKRGIIRKAWRITKKVVAPWRKWKNIS